MEENLRRDDGIGWEAAYREFILTIMKHTGERTILLSLQLHDDIQRYRASLPHRVPRAWYASGQEFCQIAKAAAAHDGKRAAALYAAYMGRLSSLVLASVAPSYDASRLRGFISALLPATSENSRYATSLALLAVTEVITYEAVAFMVGDVGFEPTTR